MFSGGLATWREENDRISKREYVEEYADSHSVGQPWKSRTDTMKGFKKKWFGCQGSKENGV